MKVARRMGWVYSFMVVILIWQLLRTIDQICQGIWYLLAIFDKWTTHIGRCFSLAEPPHDCGEHAAVLPAVDRFGRPDYFRMHLHGAMELQCMQMGSYALGDMRWWTDEQLAARDAFTAAYISYPDEALSQEQLEFLFVLVDLMFFSGTLTQSAQRVTPEVEPPPVRLHVMGYDPFSLWRIKYRMRDSPIGMTTCGRQWVDGPPGRSAGWRPYEHVVLNVARRFNGMALRKSEQVECLIHECVHAFLWLYHEQCPVEEQYVYGSDFHGPCFWVIHMSIISTCCNFHLRLVELTRTRVFNVINVATVPRGPKRTFVLLVFFLLDLFQPATDWVWTKYWLAGHRWVRFWRAYGRRGLLFVVICAVLAKRILFMLWSVLRDIISGFSWPYPPELFNDLYSRMYR